MPVTVQIRTGLHWLIEHFLASFALTLLFCLAWPRPFIVAVTIMAFAGSIEALQGLTSDRIPDLATAFCGAAGVAVGALLARSGKSAFTPLQASPPAPGAHSQNLLYP